jgi:uncharacterized peroxidase-related enzyme
LKLQQVEDGHGVISQIKLTAMRVVLGGRPPDVLKLLLYRPDLFGKAYNAHCHELMRAPSDWTVGERELFAAFVSRLNDCAFCFIAHRAVAVRALGDEIVEKALKDWRTAPVTKEVRAGLEFLEKLVKSGTSLTRADGQKLRAAGVSQDGATLLVHIAMSFSIINAMADALGFAVPSATTIAKTSAMLLRHGYKF